MTCHCEQCSKEPKPTYTEAFRHQCYMNFIIGHDPAWIESYLSEMKKNHGEAAHNRLRSDVVKAWKEKRASKKVVTN